MHPASDADRDVRDSDWKQLVYPFLPRRAIYLKARFEYRVSVIAAVCSSAL